MPASTVISVKRRESLGHERISNGRRGYGRDLEEQVVQPRSLPAEGDICMLDSVKNRKNKKRCAVPLWGEVFFFS